MNNNGQLYIATLISSKNNYLKYPCNVIINVWERDCNNNITRCTVSDGGAFVIADKAVFENLKKVPFFYHEIKQSDAVKIINHILQNFEIYQSEKLVSNNRITGIFDL